MTRKGFKPAEADEPPSEEAAELLKKAYDVKPVPGVTVSLEDYAPGWVEVANIEVEAVLRGRGLGTQAMQRLTKLADKAGINLMLILAGKYGSRKFNRLASFYQSFGFSDGSSLETMERRAAR